MFAEWESEHIVFGQELSETAVVRNERGHNTESTTCLAEGWSAGEIGCSRAKMKLLASTALQTSQQAVLTECKKHERDCEKEEEHTQADGLAECGKARGGENLVRAAIRSLAYRYVQKEESHDSPGNKVNGDGIDNLGGIGRGGIGSSDARAGDQEGRKREPERAVGGECYFFDKQPNNVSPKRKRSRV